MSNFDNTYKEMFNTVNRYTNQFKRKKAAWGLHNTKLKQKGSIDMSRIYSYKTSDNIFQKKIMQPKEKSHGIIILIDNSGSMCGTILSVVQRATELALFAKRNNISFECYTFTSSNFSMGTKYIENLSTNNLQLINLYNKTNSEKDICDIFKEYYNYKTDRVSSRSIAKNWTQGGTPLVTAYLAMMERAKIMKLSGVQHINVCVLTDGDATDELRYNNEVVTSFLDPFSQIIYNIDESIDILSNSQIDMINRILHDSDITTSHIFLTKSTGRMYSTHKDHYDINTKLLSDGIYVLSNALGFNKVLFIDESHDKINSEQLKYIMATNIVDTLCQYYLIEN